MTQYYYIILFVITSSRANSTSVYYFHHFPEPMYACLLKLFFIIKSYDVHIAAGRLGRLSILAYIRCLGDIKNIVPYFMFHQFFWKNVLGKTVKHNVSTILEISEEPVVKLLTA